MITRGKTKQIKIGDILLGGNDHIIIQSMASIKTSKIDEVSKQINKCADAGAELMRCSCLDFDDAKAFKEIKKLVKVPLVADIHFDYRLALMAIESGVDAIRLNPGNIGDEERVKAVVDACKKHNVPIRIGVNGGSIDKTVYSGNEKIRGEFLFESAKKHVSLLEKFDFHNIVISLKGSDAIETIDAYRLAANYFPYPLHLGVTEAGPMETSLIRSSATLSPLLLDGIGNTIRISLTEDPVEEIKAAYRLLHDLGLEEKWPTFISCPTCGRTQVNLLPLAKAVQKYLEDNKIYKTVAIMGCIVNGPGEAKHADLGAAGGNGKWVIFKKGQIIKTVDDSDVYTTIINEINGL